MVYGHLPRELLAVLKESWVGYRDIWNIPWGTEQAKAWRDLKDKLCQAATLQVIDFSKPFAIQFDASDYAVAGCLVQPTEDQGDKPVAFISAKLTPTQQAWSTIEKEAYAAAWALKRFRN